MDKTLDGNDQNQVKETTKDTQADPKEYSQDDGEKVKQTLDDDTESVADPDAQELQPKPLGDGASNLQALSPEALLEQRLVTKPTPPLVNPPNKLRQNSTWW